ncbi:MAG: Sulfate transport system permease protein CysW [Syntrophorhabdus sp. PtaU1.Bin050]|nr:MAG: Sulfate transport system permease protein CysW [Syntrophorhabdus sp. PtaU1.Bin050]
MKRWIKLKGQGGALGVASGERGFRYATFSALALLTLFFLILMVSLCTYGDRKILLAMLMSQEILFALVLSLSTASVSTFLSMVIAVPAAYALSQSRFRGKDVVDTVLDLPIVVSPMALGAALLIFFATHAGGSIEKALIRFVFHVPGIILAQFTIVVALAVRLLKSTFDGLNPRYEQVARTLGCSKTETFFRVTLPLARNGLIAAIVLTWARAVGEFGATITLAGAVKMKTETLPIAIFLNLSSGNIEGAIAVILILVVIASLALVTLRRLTRPLRST